MLLFNIGINTVITQCSSIENAGILCANHCITCFAYADDLALIATTRLDLQSMVNAASKNAQWTSLDFRPDKCGYMACPINGDTAQIFIANKNILKHQDNDNCQSFEV